MAGLLEFVGDAFGETLGAAWLGPIVVGGVIVAVAMSPEMRGRARKWGIKGMAAAMAAGDLATKQMKDTGDGTSGIINQFGQRMVQAAAEMREEWDDFLAEARTLKGGGPPPTREANGNSSRPRRRASKPKARRSSR
jgi:hypothetical protein